MATPANALIAPAGLTLLSAMITPAVLISASGTLILSTSNRLARIVDRVRQLGRMLEDLFREKPPEFQAERRRALDQQLSFYTTRGQLIQRALTSFYSALGSFVGTTVSIGAVMFFPKLEWVPAGLGILGTVILLYGCVLLMAEARVALRSVNVEMDFALQLGELYRQKRQDVSSAAS